ncbi:MAG: RagB/SusD family nutrient uptake outer membrane protein [Bacteroidaceae bacterium]|nr:RagB/SusD family nutrient uptake outer membrane protein [Bacteroidaceae bacterium]
MKQIKTMGAVCALMACFASSVSGQAPEWVIVNNNGETFYDTNPSIQLNDSGKVLYAAGQNLSWDDLSLLRYFPLDGVLWNAKLLRSRSTNHDCFGWPAVLHNLNLMTDEMTLGQMKNWFSFTHAGDNNKKTYNFNRLVWSNSLDMIMDCNSFIGAMKNAEMTQEERGFLGAAYATRAMLNLDLAQMFEFLDTDGATSGVSQSGDDITGLTIPIINEDTKSLSLTTSIYNCPRATKSEIIAYIKSDLEKAERLIPDLTNPAHFLPHIDVVYGLRARLGLWEENWAEAQSYAHRAIDAATAPVLNAEQMLDPERGFNNADDWMWGIVPTDFNQDMGYYASWTSFLSNEWDGYAGFNYSSIFISRKLYDKMSNSDIRKRLFVAPAGSELSGTETYNSNYYTQAAHTPYASLKFRPLVIDNVPFGNTPLMRVEEMYFIEAEAVCQQGNTAEAQRLLGAFMSQYRDNAYSFNGTSQADVLNEIILQKGIELWGEGRSFFDYKRLNLGVDRTYEGTNFPTWAQISTAHRPAWMNFVFPALEEQNNIGLYGHNNPSSDNVYSSSRVPESQVRQHVADKCVLQEPAFKKSISVLPLDSVAYIYFHHTLPRMDSLATGLNLTLNSRLELSLGADFANYRVTSPTSYPVSDELLYIPSRQLSDAVSSLCLVDGQNATGHKTVYLRIAGEVDSYENVTFHSNVITLHVQMPHYYEDGYYDIDIKGEYSQAPKLDIQFVPTLDLEAVAGLDSVKVAKVSVEQGAEFDHNILYASGSTPISINYMSPFESYGTQMKVTAAGMATNSVEGLLHELSNHVQYFHQAWVDYPGVITVQPTATALLTRDDLVFGYYNIPLGECQLKLNEQAWNETYFNWSTTESELGVNQAGYNEMPAHLNGTQDTLTTIVKVQRAVEEWPLRPYEYLYKLREELDVYPAYLSNDDIRVRYRILSPYEEGHNIMLWIMADSTVCVPSQWAYTLADGTRVNVAGNGTYVDEVFTLELTFSRPDGSEVKKATVVVGEKQEEKTLIGSYTVTNYRYNNNYVAQAEDNTYDIEIMPDPDNSAGVLIYNLLNFGHTVKASVDEANSRLVIESDTKVGQYSYYGDAFIRGVEDDFSDYSDYIYIDYNTSAGTLSSSICNLYVSSGSFGFYRFEAEHK